MVVTETSKVHNDYEFVSKDTLPYIVHDNVDLKPQPVVVSIW